MTLEPRDFLAEPYIEDESNNHTDAGQNLTLKCYLRDNSNSIKFEWNTPRGVFNVSRHN